MMLSPQKIMIIRQLDRDLALAGDRLHSRQIYQRTLWIPDEEHRQALAETLDQDVYKRQYFFHRLGSFHCTIILLSLAENVIVP